MKVEVWSDVVCPWCYIGKRRLETAIEQFDEEVDVEWRSFELDPNAAARRDLPLDELLAAKYGMSPQQARASMDRVTALASAEGLAFDFPSAKTGNTFAAHQLLQFAKTRGLAAELKERLLRAYFTEGIAISDQDALVALASEVGLGEQEARDALGHAGFGDAVRRDEAEARAIGAHGVPFFLIDGKYAVSGAQESDTLLAVFHQVRERRADSVPDAEGCTDEACDL